jgi:hypothetical protein
MRSTLWVAALVAVLAVAGCQWTRQNYDDVKIGQTADQVKKILGDPRTRLGSEWTYTADDPRDLRMVRIWFNADQKVVGKTWENPDKPLENDRDGETP